MDIFFGSRPTSYIMKPGDIMTQSIEQTLEDRGAKYGSFVGHARITQDIKHVYTTSPNWPILAYDQRECLDMIAHKIGRILNGIPDFHDSWHDIIGYAKLVADRLEEEQREKEVKLPENSKDRKDIIYKEIQDFRERAKRYQDLDDGK